VIYRDPEDGEGREENEPDDPRLDGRGVWGLYVASLATWP
jgi:hypothetical protein